jgi:hypothetical protein
MEGLAVLGESLSPAQLAFAHRMGAEARLRSQFDDGAMFFYREDMWGADRWLVDRSGQVLDHEHFANSAL